MSAGLRCGWRRTHPGGPSRARTGEPLVIARVGEPLVKVVALDGPEQAKRTRPDVLNGQFEVPEDFNTMFAKEIEEMFYGK